jgi:type IV pilus assembly protein PilZ
VSDFMTTQTVNQTAKTSQANKPGVLSLAIKEKSMLYSAYMPFVKNGGLFIPTNRTYSMGEEVFMLLNLPEDDSKISVAGKVVWINIVALAGRPQGIGVQFNNDASGLGSKNKIEALLGISIKSSRPTHTI